MDDPGQRDTYPKPSFLNAVGVAVLVGLLGGAAIGLRETARVALRYTEAFTSFNDVLSLGVHSAFWHALPAGVFMGLVGVAMGILILAGRTKLRGSGLIAAYAGLFLFLFMPMLLSSGTAGPFLHVEHCLVGVLCGTGLGCVAYYFCESVGRRAGILPVVLGLGVAAFILVHRALWFLIAGYSRFIPAKPPASEALFVCFAIVAGVAVYYVMRCVRPNEDAKERKQQLRRAFLFTAGAAVLAPVAKWLESVFSPLSKERPKQRPIRRTSSDKPNVLWIVMDTARADALSCYGYSRKTTPHLDAIAGEGVVYENAFATAPWTLPSHASMFTGALPCKHKATSEHLYLGANSTTIAELLIEHGYSTFSYSNNGWIGGVHNLLQGFEHYVMSSYGSHRRMLLFNRIRARLHLADYGARETNRVLKERLTDQASAGRPFFMFVNYMEAHARYGVTPYLRKWLGPKVSLQQALSVSQEYGRYAAGLANQDQERFDALRALYDGDVSYLDFHVGQLIEHVKDLGILDNTVLIITSDHGEELGEHGLIDHAVGLYNTMLHVPLIIRYPRAFKPGERETALVQLTDIAPTIVDLLGAERPKAFGGESLLGQARPRSVVAERGLPIPWTDYTIERFRDWKGVSLLRRLKSIQTSDLKYVWSSDGEDELYDIRKDPQEKSNLIAAMPSKAKELRDMLADRVGDLRREHA